MYQIYEITVSKCHFLWTKNKSDAKKDLYQVAIHYNTAILSN